MEYLLLITGTIKNIGLTDANDQIFALAFSLTKHKNINIKTFPLTLPAVLSFPDISLNRSTNAKILPLLTGIFLFSGKSAIAFGCLTDCILTLITLKPKIA